MGFNTAPNSGNGRDLVSTAIVNQIHVDGVNTKGLPTGYSPSVVYRIGDGTVHPDGWDNVSGNEYLDFYMPSYFGNAEAIDIRTVAENINYVQATGSNIGAVVALEANYDEIKTVSEQANFGLFNAINLSANVIGVNATIATGQNGVSFGDMTIEEGVTVTVGEGSSWAIN